MPPPAQHGRVRTQCRRCHDRLVAPFQCQDTLASRTSFPHLSHSWHSPSLTDRIGPNCPCRQLEGIARRCAKTSTGTATGRKVGWTWSACAGHDSNDCTPVGAENLTRRTDQGRCTRKNVATCRASYVPHSVAPAVRHDPDGDLEILVSDPIGVFGTHRFSAPTRSHLLARRDAGS